MVVYPFEQRPDLPHLLPATLKALRRLRGVRAADMATGLNMPTRSYEHFESGRGRLNVGRIHQAAGLLDADPFAILAALELGSPAFAVRCADSKLMIILMLLLKDLDARLQDKLLHLDAGTLIEAFTRLFEELVSIADTRATAVADLRARRGGQDT